MFCVFSDGLPFSQEELEDELEGLDDEDENGAISEKKIHVRFELERVQHDLDQTVRSRECVAKSLPSLRE